MTCRIEKRTNFLPMLLKLKTPKGILIINTSKDTGSVNPNREEILLMRIAKPVKPLESNFAGVMNTLIQNDWSSADKKTQISVLRYLLCVKDKLLNLVTIDNLILHFIVRIIAIRYLTIWCCCIDFIGFTWWMKLFNMRIFFKF